MHKIYRDKISSNIVGVSEMPTCKGVLVNKKSLNLSSSKIFKYSLRRQSQRIKTHILAKKYRQSVKLRRKRFCSMGKKTRMRMMISQIMTTMIIAKMLIKIRPNLVMINWLAKGPHLTQKKMKMNYTCRSKIKSMKIRKCSKSN